MPFQWNENQKLVLEKLLDKYENSKSYEDKNLIRQRFSVKPEDICDAYRDSFADVNRISDFEQDVQALEREGLVKILSKNGEIQKIVAQEERITEYYLLLGRIEKKELISREMSLYQNFLGKNILLDRFCMEQIRRLEKGNRPEVSKEKTENLLLLIQFILNNQEEFLERELSIRFFGDTKLFEKSYRAAVCKIMEKYGNYQERLFGVSDSREKELILLGEHNIHANPTYVYVRGNGEFLLKNGTVLCLTPENPIAFSAETIKNMDKMLINNEKVMTIENLASFHRVHDQDTFYIFLSGYHNTLKQHFIMRLAQENPKLRWYHFGDLDPDGYYILEHLKRGTGIAFEPFHMGVDDLIKFEEYGKKLSETDRKKASILLNSGLYYRELSYMIEKNVKLEQEIIAWELNDKKYVNKAEIGNND